MRALCWIVIQYLCVRPTRVYCEGQVHLAPGSLEERPAADGGTRQGGTRPNGRRVGANTAKMDCVVGHGVIENSQRVEESAEKEKLRRSCRYARAARWGWWMGELLDLWEVRTGDARRRDGE